MFIGRIFGGRSVPGAVILGDYRGLDDQQSKTVKVSRIVLFGALTATCAALTVPTGNIFVLSAALFFGYKFLKVLTGSEESSFLKIFTAVLKFVGHCVSTSGSRRYTHPTSYTAGGYEPHTPHEQPYGYTPTVGRGSLYQTTYTAPAYQPTAPTERDTVGRGSPYQTTYTAPAYRPTAPTERDTVGSRRNTFDEPLGFPMKSSRGGECDYPGMGAPLYPTSYHTSSSDRDEVGRRGTKREATSNSNERDQVGRR